MPVSGITSPYSVPSMRIFEAICFFVVPCSVGLDGDRYASDVIAFFATTTTFDWVLTSSLPPRGRASAMRAYCTPRAMGGSMPHSVIESPKERSPLNGSLSSV